MISATENHRIRYLILEAAQQLDIKWCHSWLGVHAK